MSRPRRPRFPLLAVLAALAAAPWRQAAAQTGPVQICQESKEQYGANTVWPLCGRWWALENADRIVEFWEVHELEFYWDSMCTDTWKLPMGLPVSSEVNTALALVNNRAEKAWDRNLNTRFTSNCKSVLGGCKPRDAFIGKDIRGAPKFKPESYRTHASVYCLKIWQSPNITKMTTSVNLVTWVNASYAHIIATYDSLGGANWHQRPAYEAGLWRLYNVDPILKPWEVSEIRFYSDLFCTKEVHGIAISSCAYFPDGCYDERFGCPIAGCFCDDYLPKNLMDGTTLPGAEHPVWGPTKWKAPCNSTLGCEGMESWIGIDFNDQPIMVECYKLWQPVNEGYPNWGVPHYADRMMLRMWDGYNWKDAGIFGGFLHGGWNDTRPAARTSWRLSNFDRVPAFWEVYKVAFYEELYCGDQSLDPNGLVGTPINSNPAMVTSQQDAECRLQRGSCAGHAFDRALGAEPHKGTAWQSDCDPCPQREAWIGLRFREPTEVRCFRFYQSNFLAYRTEAVELAVWNGESWEQRRFESGLAGGSWNYRPAPPLTAWRVVATSNTEKPWIVSGLGFFEDEACSTPELTGSMIAVGSELNNPPSKAFERDPDGLTEWIASCTPPMIGMQGCAANNVWIGLQSERDGFTVKCVRLRQHRNREHQTQSAALQKWDGMKWAPLTPTEMPLFSELSGGSWQTFPGVRGSMWRMVFNSPEGALGVGVSELAFHRSADCADRPLQSEVPNYTPISSGYGNSRDITLKTGYTAHLITMGEIGNADPTKAFDEDLGTFWADLVGVPGWLGIDLTTQVADVQCVRLSMVPILTMQAESAQVQAWTGSQWATQATMDNRALRIDFPLTTAGGWQHRPALPDTVWRIENAVPVNTWQVHEIEFYGDVACKADSLLPHWHAVASARNAENAVPAGGHLLPERVFDRDTRTYWKADCPARGCQPGEAWIGASYRMPVDIRCLRLWQTGRRIDQATSLNLVSWAGDSWVNRAYYHGLGGDSWMMRPSPPDILWRIVFEKRREEECSNMPVRPDYQRAWGISELMFYGDDDCEQQLIGHPITSGSWEMQTADGLQPVSPSRALDNSTKTYWAANCGARFPLDTAACEEGKEWIGLDFSQTLRRPMEVRCVKAYQSQANNRECCDPAENYRLERWNGSDWSRATWRHLPAERGSTPRIIDASFESLGQCPPILSLTQDQKEAAFWNIRSRRDSSTCKIILTKALTLLADKLCEKHPACVAAGFTTGYCCPMDAQTSTARCCCDIPSVDIFEDELKVGIDRNPLESELFPTVGIEYIIIRFLIVMPWIGIVLVVMFYIIATADRSEQGQKSYRLWEGVCGPVHRWMDRGTPAASLVTFVCRKGPKEKLQHTVMKRLLVLVSGFLLGGFILWIFVALILAELLLWLMMFFGYFIRWAKSPYNPGEPSEKRRLMIVMAIPIGGSDGKTKFQVPAFGKLIGSLFGSISLAGVYFVRAIFDIVILRFAMMNVSMVDMSVSVPEILVRVPTIALNMNWLTDYVYAVLSTAAVVFMEMFASLFEGVPRCEGPVLVFSGMWLIGITAVLIRWLSYDYFGLLLSSKTTLTKTRPVFQKGMAVGMTMGVQAAVFIFLQLNTLMFTRAINLVNVDPTAPDGVWMCPYQDEGMAKIFGRLFLAISAIIATSAAALCANGHFVGLRRLNKPFSDKVGMDLSQLDPDNNGLVRWTGFMSMLPTTLGIWIDGWNVSGYLVKQRAELYAKELNFPDYCEHCQCHHIPYQDIMKATGLQLSLAYQMMPFGVGAVVGKGCEYLNNPPLYYHGEILKCMKANPSLDAAREGKKDVTDFKSGVKYRLGIAAALAKDKAVPLVSSSVGLVLYICLIFFTYSINKDNLETMAVQMFQTLMFLVSMKAIFEIALPLLLVLVLGLIFLTQKKKAKDVASKMAEKASRDLQSRLSEGTPKSHPSPLIGQVVHGVLAGGAISVYLMKYGVDGLNRDTTTLLAALLGVVASLFIVAVAFVLEQFKGGRLGAAIVFTVYSVCGALAVSKLVGYPFSSGVQWVITAIVGLVLILVTGLCFVPPSEDPYVEGLLLSQLLPRLKGPRTTAGPFGIISGVFVGSLLFEILIDYLGWYLGLPCAGAIALIVGIGYALLTDDLVSRPPGQYAMATGTILVVVIGILVHWLIACVVASLAATLVGSYFEMRQMRRLDEHVFEPARLMSSKSVIRATATLGMEHDVPAWYRVLRDGLEVRATEVPTEGVVAELNASDVVEVLEVMRVPGMEHRMQGFIEDPIEGWIDILDLDNGYQWCEKVEFSATLCRAETPTRGDLQMLGNAPGGGRGGSQGGSRRESQMSQRSQIQSQRSQIQSQGSEAWDERQWSGVDPQYASDDGFTVGLYDNWGQEPRPNDAFEYGAIVATGHPMSPMHDLPELSPLEQVGIAKTRKAKSHKFGIKTDVSSKMQAWTQDLKATKPEQLPRTPVRGTLQEQLGQPDLDPEPPMPPDPEPPMPRPPASPAAPSAPRPPADRSQDRSREPQSPERSQERSQRSRRGSAHGSQSGRSSHGSQSARSGHDGRGGQRQRSTAHGVPVQPGTNWSTWRPT